MVKKKVVKEKVETKEVKEVVKKYLSAPSSDMWAIYEAVGERLIENDILVNSDYPIRVELQNDFVDDCKAMITTVPYVFEAKMHCMVAKGEDTGLRLDLLKNVVRAALINAPLELGQLQISMLVLSEEDERITGYRKSVLTLLMTAEKTKKNRRIIG